MEITTLNDTLEALGTKFQSHQQAMENQMKELAAKQLSLRNEISDLVQDRGTPAGWGVPAQKSMGSMVLDSPEAKALIERRAERAVIPITLDIKSLLVGTAGDSASTLVNVQPQRASQIGEDARRRIQLLQDLPRVVVNSGSYEFHRLGSFTNAADIQELEGDLKAEQDMTLPVQTATIATIAVTLPCSEQLLADAPGLSQFLDSKLRFGILEKLEAELIGGTGGAGAISGLIAQSTAYAPTAGRPQADRISEALTALEVSGWQGTHIIMHPADWSDIRTERTIGSGEYVAESWATTLSKSIWGVPVVTTNSMPEGEAMVIDARQVALLDRQNANVMLGYSGTGFAQNIITMRAELRAGLAVYSPSAVLKFDLAAS